MKLFILGTGFLAQYLMPCYRHMLGEDFGAQMLGVKATARNIEETRANCPFPVEIQGADGSLRRFSPDIIVIGVRPQQVTQVVGDTLAPYFDELRRDGRPLPLLYVLAPDPTVDYYRDALGEDVLAVYQYPNMTRELGGRDVSQVGVAFVTFDKRAVWPVEARAQAMRFLEPVGKVFEIGADQASPFIALQCACHVLFDVCFLIEDELDAAGRKLTHSEVASAMRRAFRPLFTEEVAGIIPCLEELDDDALKELLRRFIYAWREGLVDFARFEGLPEAASVRNIAGTIESICMQVQTETRAALEAITRSHATPDGYLEMALRTFRSGAPALESDVRSLICGAEVERFDEDVRALAFRIAHAVSEHGKTVGGVKK